MKRIILLTLLIPVLAHAQPGRYGHTSGSTFYWNKSGEAQKSDSIRYIQGSNITLTQSGNTLTIAGAAGAGSTANVRANTGWTAQGGTTATDTVVTYLLWNGKYQRAMFVDTDNDSVIIAPHALYPFLYKDAGNILAVVDSSGSISSGDPTAASGYARLGTSVSSLLGVGNTSVTLWRAGTASTGITLTDGFAGGMSSSTNSFITNYEAGDFTLGTANANRFTILNSGANNWNQLYNTGGSGATLLHFSNTTTGTTIGSDGFDIGIGADEVAEITQRENLAMKFFTNNTRRLTIGANGEIGIGGTTDAQNARAKFNVLGRAANDTLAIWSNDGGGVVGDSAIFILGNGSLKSGKNYLQISSQFGAQLGNLLLESTFGLSDFATGASIRLVGTTGSIKFFPVGASAQTLIAKTTTKASQGFFTVNAEGTTDTLLVARNDKNSTLDSTMMVFANGDGYFGGNNLYLGGHRIRSNAAGDSLIFYDGSTMIFAILSDGTTADLVATTPFWKFFDKFRNEVLFWILAVAGILACILALLSIYAKVRMLRFGGYETLVENS